LPAAALGFLATPPSASSSTLLMFIGFATFVLLFSLAWAALASADHARVKTF
jgi:hypothetical protein